MYNIIIAHSSSSSRAFFRRYLEKDPSVQISASTSRTEQLSHTLKKHLPTALVFEPELLDGDVVNTLEEFQASEAFKTNPCLLFMLSSSQSPSSQTSASQQASSAKLCQQQFNLDGVFDMNTDGDIEKALSTITGDILAKVKCRPKPVHDVQASTPAPKLSPQRNVIHRLDAIVIGSSTGGPNALQELIPSISAFCDVPIFIVQHMQKNFTASLAESLNANCQGLVKEAKHNEEAQPHHIYIAPGDQHLTLKRINHKIIIQLNQDAPECFCRPSVDVMFRSAASAWGHHCLAIVLTGMGSDGTKGLAHLKEKGVHVLVQDEASSVVWGMPGSAVKAGWADEILPLENIPPRVQQLLNFSRQ